MALHRYRTDAGIAATEAETARADAPVYWICLALLLAVVTLAMRIASIW